MTSEDTQAARAGSASREAMVSLVIEEFPRLAAGLFGPLLDLLSLARRACGGDSDKFLIMLVVTQRTVEHEQFAAFSPADLQSGKIPVLPSRGTNVSSVADSLGAPKETVRRKVAELVADGWIARRGHDLCCTGLAYQQLADIRTAMARLAVRNFETVEALSRRAEPG